MDHFAQLALILIVIALAIPLVQIISVVIQVLRLRIWPARFELAPETPPLTDDQAAAFAELEALGFARSAFGWLEQGPMRYGCQYFRHESAPAVAALSLRASVYTGYPVTFYSLNSAGQLLMTSNRLAWAFLATPHETQVQDAYADSLAQHWKVHQARLAGLQDALACEAVEARVMAEIPRALEAALASGALSGRDGQWHPGLRAALRAGAAWFRVRRRLARPYVSASTVGDRQSDFFALCYREMEAQRQHMPMRRDVRVWLLALSFVLSLLLWGTYVGWAPALMLAVILAVHEGGHALAMRLFGFRDLTMFFIPFVGAVVTGVPKELAAWKQAVVLLAGPLPGLVAGLAMIYFKLGQSLPESGIDWSTAATMAVLINAFNLLPFTPLDGGQLLDLAVFQPWPRLRLAFVSLSVLAFFALALWLASPAAWVLALVMAYGMRAQWRMARLQLAWKNGLALPEQLRRLFAVARGFGVQTFARQYGLVRAVVMTRQMHAARWWETAGILALLVPLWAGAAWVAIETWSPRTAAAATREPGTPAQQAFDAEYRKSDEDDEDDLASLARLRQLATALAADDPRRVDLAVREVRAAAPSERTARWDSIIARGKEGKLHSLRSIEREALDEVVFATWTLPPEARAQALQEAVDRVTKLQPGTPEGTIAARLYLAEAFDQKGDSDQAWIMLQELRNLAENDSRCHCELPAVLRAQAWYHMSHGRGAEALRVLDAAPAFTRKDYQTRQLRLDRAWALLTAGDKSQALIEMRAAAYVQPRAPRFGERIFGVRRGPPRLVSPKDLAHALVAADRNEEARALVSREAPWICRSTREASAPEIVEPWQGLRLQALRQTSRAICAGR